MKNWKLIFKKIQSHDEECDFLSHYQIVHHNHDVSSKFPADFFFELVTHYKRILKGLREKKEANFCP